MSSTIAVTNETSFPACRRSWWKDLVVLVFLQAALGSVWLNTVPRFYMDEAWNASLGGSLVREGRLRHGIIEGYGGMHIYFVQSQFTVPFVVAGCIKLLGFSPAVARIGSVMMACLAVAGGYGVVRRLYSRRLAWVACILLMIHPWFFEIARRVRPEVYETGFLLVGLWIWVSGVKRSSVWALPAGFFVGEACLSHPTGCLLTAAVFTGLLCWRRDTFTVRRVVWAGVGLAVALLPYALYLAWVLPHPEVHYFQQMQNGGKDFVFSLSQIVTLEAGRWKRFLRLPLGLPVVVVMGAAFILAWFRSERNDRLIATILLVFTLILGVGTQNTTARYLACTTPFWCILIARMLARAGRSISNLSGTGKKRLAWTGLTGLVLLYVVPSFGALGLLVWRNRDADIERLMSRVTRTLGPEDTVCGQMIYYMAGDRLAYGPYVLDEKWKHSVDDFRQKQFQYVIRMAWGMGSSHGIATPPRTMPPFRSRRVFDRMAERYGRLIDAWRDPSYGPIEIYRLDWNRARDPVSDAERLSG